MPPSRESSPEDGELAPLQDLTQDLALHSKRTKRLRRKLEKRAQTKSASGFAPRGFLDMPLELLMAILNLLRPSDIVALMQVSKELREFLLENEETIARRIVKLRYPILERCFPRPVLMQDIDPSAQPLLKSGDRFSISDPSYKFQNIPSPEYAVHCTCLTCTGRWNALCAAVDFSRWQVHLDMGEPIPTVPRGTNPPWNETMLAWNRRVVLNSLTSPLWYARILETHLDSTMRSIRRHSRNKADQRPHFRLTDADMRAGTDAFLDLEGPPTVEYPYSREVYYMLEAFLPARSWAAEKKEWLYVSQASGPDWHDIDLGMLLRMDALKRQTHQTPVTEASCAQGNGQVSGPMHGEEQPVM